MPNHPTNRIGTGEAREGIDEAARTAVDAALSQGIGAAVLKKYADLQNGKDEELRAQLKQYLVFLLENEQLKQGEGETAQMNLTERAQQIMNEFLKNEDFFKSFCKYILSLRCEKDQNQFIRAIFEHGTDFDASLLEEKLTPEYLWRLIYALQLPIEYNESAKTVAEIFKAHPELDYHRLAKDANFAQSPEGVKLQAAYKKLCGSILNDTYQRPISARISPIPIAKYPFAEAFIVDEVSGYVLTSRPAVDTAPWIEAIWQSDSQKAQKALVAYTNTRLPRGKRGAINGPTEFEHKSDIISALLRAYDENVLGEEAHENLRAHVLEILSSYTFDGPIATSVRKECKNRNNSSYKPVEVKKVQKIVCEILEIILPDSNAYAREVGAIIMNQYAIAQSLEMPLPTQRGGQENGGVLVEKDILALDKATQQSVLTKVRRRLADLEAFQRIGDITGQNVPALFRAMISEIRNRVE